MREGRIERTDRQTDRQTHTLTHTHTQRTATITLAHARRGLIKNSHVLHAYAMCCARCYSPLLSSKSWKSSTLSRKHCQRRRKKKSHRDSSQAGVDAALFQWFTAAIAQSIPMSGEVVMAKAKELALKLDLAGPWTCLSGSLS